MKTKRQMQQEEKALKAIAEMGGTVTVFWCTDNRLRAAALCRLQDEGRLVPHVNPPGFPCIRFEVRATQPASAGGTVH